MFLPYVLITFVLLALNLYPFTTANYSIYFDFMLLSLLPFQKNFFFIDLGPERATNMLPLP